MINIIKRKLLEKSYEIYTKVVYNLPERYIPLPPLIIWVITYRCNLRCNMCTFYGAGGKLPDLNYELPIGDIKAIIHSLKQTYEHYPYKPFFGIIGGEPFIHPHIFEIFKYLKYNGFRYAVTTNLVLLNDEKIAKLMKIGINDLRVSLDGPEEIHDQIRNLPGTFKKVMTNLKKIRSDETGNKIPIRLNCVICPENINYLADMPAIAKEYNADLSFQHLMFIDEKHEKANYEITQKLLGEEFSIDATKMRLSKNQVELAKVNIKKMFEIANHLDVKVSFTPNLKMKEFDEYYFNLDNYIHSRKCDWPWGCARITPYGNVNSCFYTIGDLKTESFKKIWNGQRAGKIRTTLKNIKLFPGCIRCCKI